MLAGYGWPGNVRERVNVLELAVNLTGEEILPEPLPERCRAPTAPGQLPPAALGPVEPSVALTTREKRAVEQALERHRGSRRKGAGATGMSRTTLHRKIRECGICRSSAVRDASGSRTGSAPIADSTSSDRR
ncbi:MAG: hypothetical protein HZB55_03010 [Deltaproteobacteria bacterium]|nr:hypothetical protein [Deltaproteobacteria bacterium]